MNTKGTEAEAKANCSLLDSTSTLVNIGSKTEQEYLNEHLKAYHTLSKHIWIGLEYASRSFQWMDGTRYQYQNWGENAIKDGSNRCVQMSLTTNDLGHWTDDNCNRKYLFVCQKIQSSKSVLTEQVRNLTNVIDNLSMRLLSISDKQQKEISEIKYENKHQQDQIEMLKNKIKSQSERIDNLEGIYLL